MEISGHPKKNMFKEHPKLSNPVIPCQIEYQAVLRCFIAAFHPFPEGGIL